MVAGPSGTGAKHPAPDASPGGAHASFGTPSPFCIFRCCVFSIPGGDMTAAEAQTEYRLPSDRFETVSIRCSPRMTQPAATAATANPRKRPSPTFDDQEISDGKLRPGKGSPPKAKGQQNSWVLPANDCVRLRFPSIGAEDGGEEISSFRPDFTYPFFGEEELVFGYRDLEVTVNLGSTSYIFICIISRRNFVSYIQYTIFNS